RDSDDIAESAVVVSPSRVPYKATVADIEEFFSSRLRGPALSLNKQYIGHRYVEIFPSNLAEMKRTLHQAAVLAETPAAFVLPGVRIAPDGLLLVFDRFQQFTRAAPSCSCLGGGGCPGCAGHSLAAGGDSVRELNRLALDSSREAYREANRQHLLAGHGKETPHRRCCVHGVRVRDCPALPSNRCSIGAMVAQLGHRHGFLLTTAEDAQAAVLKLPQEAY
uniref:Tick transposon n=1 Tax=Macrostomum lignano TaxID=282301 RepID=A0A1I8FFL0_9PLAT